MRERKYDAGFWWGILKEMRSGRLMRKLEYNIKFDL
jgi:hypothetical protein